MNDPGCNGSPAASAWHLSMCPSGYMDGEILRPCGEMKTLNHQGMVGYVIIHVVSRREGSMSHIDTRDNSAALAVRHLLGEIGWVYAIPRRVRAEGPSMTGRNYKVAECPQCRLRVLVTVVGSAMLIDPISQCEHESGMGSCPHSKPESPHSSSHRWLRHARAWQQLTFRCLRAFHRRTSALRARIWAAISRISASPTLRPVRLGKSPSACAVRPVRSTAWRSRAALNARVGPLLQQFHFSAERRPGTAPSRNAG